MIFTPDATAVYNTDIQVSQRYVVPLVDGVLTATLPATDVGNPTGWTYHVIESFDGGREYHINAPTGSNQLTDLAPVPSNGGEVITVGPVGPQGIQGIQGIPGAPGSQIYTGTGAPTVTHNDLDLYIDTAANNTYQQQSGAWTLITSLGSASTHAATDFATAAQGIEADTAVQPARQVTAGTGLTGGGDLSANRSLAVVYGTTAGTAAQGNDSRIVGAIPASTVTTKGDLLVAAGSGALTRLPVGNNNRQVFADSTQPSGLRWSGAGELPGAADISNVALGTIVTPGSYFYGNTCTDTPVAGQAGMLLVTRRQSALDFIVQQVWAYNGTWTASRTSSNGGVSWGSWLTAVTNSAGAGNTMTGTGSPQGVVTAPVGTTYIDTNATGGVVEYTKMTGLGNTGWDITKGDTYVVNVPLANGVTGSLFIRRQNYTVNIWGTGIVPNTTNSINILAAPLHPGYWPRNTRNVPAAVASISRTANLAYDGSTLTLLGIASANETWTLGIEYLTPATTWPSLTQ